MSDEQTTPTASPSEGLTAQDFARLHHMARKQFRDTVQKIAGLPVGLEQVLPPMVYKIGRLTAEEAGVVALDPTDRGILPASSDEEETAV